MSLFRLKGVILFVVLLTSSLAAENSGVFFNGINIGDDWESVLESVMIMHYEISEQQNGVIRISGYKLAEEVVEVEFIFVEDVLLGYSFWTNSTAKFADAQKNARIFAEVLSHKYGNASIQVSPREEEVRDKGSVLYRNWNYSNRKIEINLLRRNARYMTVINVL